MNSPYIFPYNPKLSKFLNFAAVYSPLGLNLRKLNNNYVCEIYSLNISILIEEDQLFVFRYFKRKEKYFFAASAT
jgi:hypothetical protein